MRQSIIELSLLRNGEKIFKELLFEKSDSKYLNAVWL